MKKLIFNAKKFNQTIKELYHAINIDDKETPILSCIHLKVLNGCGVEFCSTDENRMTLRRVFPVNIDEVQSMQDFELNLYAVDILKKLDKSVKDDTVVIETDSEKIINIKYSSGHAFVLPVIDDTFPKYDKLIQNYSEHALSTFTRTNDDYKQYTRIRINKNFLIECLKSINDSPFATIEFDKNYPYTPVTVTSHSIDGDTFEMIMPIYI